MITASGSPVPEMVTSETSSAPGTTNSSPLSGAVIVTSAFSSSAFGPTVAFASSIVVAAEPGRTVTMAPVIEKTPSALVDWLLTVTLATAGSTAPSAGESSVVTGVTAVSTAAPTFPITVWTGARIAPATTPRPTGRVIPPSTWIPEVFPSSSCPMVVFTLRTGICGVMRVGGITTPPRTVRPRTAFSRAVSIRSVRPLTASTTAAWM